MILTIGQRWRYKEENFDFIVEVLRVGPLQTKVLQANPYSRAEGWYPDKETFGDGLQHERHHGISWYYLEGQDAPK
jgi:hypothetical protein